jgi:hypothetical protein
MQSSGRWAVCRPGRDPVDITSGELFRIEVEGELRVTRIEELYSEGYYSVDGYPLRDGVRAAIGAGSFQEQRDAKGRAQGGRRGCLHRCVQTVCLGPAAMSDWRGPQRLKQRGVAE